MTTALSCAMIVCDKEKLQWSLADLFERHRLVTQVSSFCILRRSENACCGASILVAVDIPEGFERIGYSAFCGCSSLTTILFPTMFTPIGEGTFQFCESLENIDLLHTNLEELGAKAFRLCSELKSMTIPDSLQTLGGDVFEDCSKLVPSDIVYNNDAVIAYLRSKQQPQP